MVVVTTTMDWQETPFHQPVVEKKQQQRRDKFLDATTKQASQQKQQLSVSISLIGTKYLNTFPSNDEYINNNNPTNIPLSAFYNIFHNNPWWIPSLFRKQMMGMLSIFDDCCFSDNDRWQSYVLELCIWRWNVSCFFKNKWLSTMIIIIKET